MPDVELQERADRRLEEVLERTGARDPRSFYRDRLRELKARDPSAYERAVRHYGEVLLPAIADDGEDPLEAWTEYGRALAELTAPGRTVSIDRTGRSGPFERGATETCLVLHLPRARNLPALLVGLPPELSPAQRATYDWLVAGLQTLRD
ncbi:MAG: hypothetical protein PVI57_16870 [Gemmatimonadota bacterium]|jgi:hypothetical protein